jgi:hypothetical protein
MSYLSNKIRVLKESFIGNLMKVKVLYDIRLRKAMTLSSRQAPSVIVSLTSYGKRVSRSAVYTVYSLLNQTVRAERIVLWLNEEQFNDENLPASLRFLCRYGLEIRYGKDIGSYTKIIHSLSAYPDKHIITADDDLYYSSTFVEEFVAAHRQHPKAIITAWGKLPTKDSNHQLVSYDSWQEYHWVPSDFQYDTAKLSPMGVGGVLYPSHVFDSEVSNEAVFTTLCPKADDIWLYIMGIRSGAEKRFLSASRISYYQTDLLRQYLTRDRLTATNRLKLKNDTQLKALLAHYKIPIKDITIDI